MGPCWRGWSLSSARMPLMERMWSASRLRSVFLQRAPLVVAVHHLSFDEGKRFRSSYFLLRACVWCCARWSGGSRSGRSAGCTSGRLETQRPSGSSSYSLPVSAKASRISCSCAVAGCGGRGGCTRESLPPEKWTMLDEVWDGEDGFDFGCDDRGRALVSLVRRCKQRQHVRLRGCRFFHVFGTVRGDSFLIWDRRGSRRGQHIGSRRAARPTGWGSSS